MDQDTEKEIKIKYSTDERKPILNQERCKSLKTEVYTRRWYILFVYCLTCFTNAMMWNTWGPITESAEAVFGWDDGNIGMLSNYGNISYMIFVLPMCWIMDEKGLRWAAIVASCISLIGAGIRCISLEPTIATWMANICAFLAGIAGSVCDAGPSLVSSVWFPSNQRATATAVMLFATYFGIGMSFIIDITNIPEMKDDIQDLMFLHGGFTALSLLLTLIYFPAKPPKPPSDSASVERVDYIKGLRQLLSMCSVWLVVLAFSLPAGILQVWATVLDVNLKPLGIDQKTVGYIGFWQTMAGCAAGVIVSRFSDIFTRRMKLFLVAMYIGAACTSAWLTVLCEKYIPLNIPSLYIACIFVGIFVNGSIPLFYEITCEASHPVAEGVTVGWLTLVSNVCGTCFLFPLLIKSIGTSWMNWVLTGSIVLALPLLSAFRNEYRRMDLDLKVSYTATLQND